MPKRPPPPAQPETDTVSPSYQVVIPASARDALQVHPGQKLQVVVLDGRIELIPLVPMREFRGFLPGLDTNVPREEQRE